MHYDVHSRLQCVDGASAARRPRVGRASAARRPRVDGASAATSAARRPHAADLANDDRRRSLRCVDACVTVAKHWKSVEIPLQYDSCNEL